MEPEQKPEQKASLNPPPTPPVPKPCSFCGASDSMFTFNQYERNFSICIDCIGKAIANMLK